jgi:hypothetical protein
MSAYGSLHVGFMGPQADGRTLQTVQTEDITKDVKKHPANMSVSSSLRGISDDSTRNVSHHLVMQDSLCVSNVLN